MATARDILSGAYNRSASNDPGKLAQDGELLAHMNRLYQRLWALFSRARPEEAGSTTTVTLAGMTPAATLPTDLVDLLLCENADGDPVHLIPAHERLRLWHVAPSAYRLGTTLYSRNLAGDPIAGDVLTLTLIQALTTITAGPDVLDTRFPTRHHQILVDSLALYLSVKDSGRSDGDRQALLVDLRTAAAAFAAEYHLPPSAISWVHAPVSHQEMPA